MRNLYFRFFIFLKLAELCRFVTYLWNDPRSLELILTVSGLLPVSGTDAEKDLASQNIAPSYIAGLLKKFLRELPDSVIPEQSYQAFIDAASEFCVYDFSPVLQVLHSWLQLICSTIEAFSGVGG